MPIHRVLEHRARAVVALLALTLVAAALAACGSSSGGASGGGGGGDAQALLKQTFTGAHKIKSGKANVQLTVDAQGDPSIRGPIKLGITGPFQSEGAGKLPQFDLAVTVGFQGQTYQAGLTSTGSRLFIGFGGTNYEAPASLVQRLQQSMAQAQQKSSSQSGKLNLAGLGIDPLSWLENPQVTGTETIGGVETKHVTAQVKVPALLDDLDKLLAKASSQGLGAAGASLPKSLPADTRAKIQDAIKSATVDVWTGTKDTTLRKLALGLSVAPKSGSGPTSATVSFSIELQDLNQPQTISAPANSQPLSQLLGQFQGLFGGSLGGGALGGGSSGGGGSGSGGSSAKVDKYAKCLKDAGADVQKAQGCASLLTK